MRRVALLGATGSIGRQAIEVIAAHPELELCSLQSGTTPLDALAAEHGVANVQVGGSPVELLERSAPDLVLNAIVGFAGVDATLWALEHGVTLALANKESLVAAGELAVAAHARGGGLLIPVDSEHSALFQCLEGRGADSVEGLVLTASGGPFRGRTAAELADVTPEQALAHPNFAMGRVITTNSATLVNKGLEVIEAHLLFDIPFDHIDVVVHPQQLIHSMVEFVDGAVVAQLGLPTMLVPISLGMGWPDRVPDAETPIDWTKAADWRFEPLDDVVFPAVSLARTAGERGGTAPAVYNAANEVAVDAFHEGRLRFPDIVATVAHVLDRHDVPSKEHLTVDDVLAADSWARAEAAALI